MSNRSNPNFLFSFSLFAAAVCLWPAAPALGFDEPEPNTDRSARTILASESWRKTMNALDEWFSVQPLYDRKEGEVVKNDLARRLEAMSPNELEAFKDDLDAKLGMVLGAEGRDVLGWVAASWRAASPTYRKKMDLDYPDVVKLTAAQLREQLDLLERKRETARNRTAKLEQSRQTRIAALQAEQHQRFEERERALDRGALGGGYRAPYNPGGVRQYPDVVSRPQYVWGWGFGFW